jgi:hypothetical protein
VARKTRYGPTIATWCVGAGRGRCAHVLEYLEAVGLRHVHRQRQASAISLLNHDVWCLAETITAADQPGGPPRGDRRSSSRQARHKVRDTHRQVWFDSRYDVDVHTIQPEQPANGILPRSRVWQASLGIYLFFSACSPRCLAVAFSRLNRSNFGMRFNG